MLLPSSSSDADVRAPFTLDRVSDALADERCRRNYQALVAGMDARASEVWRFVVTPHFRSTEYIVSSHGRVLSLPRYRVYPPRVEGGRAPRRFLPGTLMKPGAQPSGYQTITLMHDGARFSTHVHRLVAWAFLGPQPDGIPVRHRDANPANNHVDNLVYGSDDVDTGVQTAAPNVRGHSSLIIRPDLEARIEAALRGERDPLPVLQAIHDMIAREGRSTATPKDPDS